MYPMCIETSKGYRCVKKQARVIGCTMQTQFQLPVVQSVTLVVYRLGLYSSFVYSSSNIGFRKVIIQISPKHHLDIIQTSPEHHLNITQKITNISPKQPQYMIYIYIYIQRQRSARGLGAVELQAGFVSTGVLRLFCRCFTDSDAERNDSRCQNEPQKNSKLRSKTWAQ